MSNGPIDFRLLERVLKRQANRDNRKLPKLSHALSNIDESMMWVVRDVDNNEIARVDSEKVEWIDNDML